MSYQPLVNCSGCARHVRHDELRCPFCREVLQNASLAPDTDRRMGRAAAFVFGASVSVACGSTVETVGDPPAGAGGAGAAGATSATSSGSTSTTTGQGGDPSGAGGGQLLYGAPAVGGAGGEASGSGGEASGVGGFSADYGAPPPP